MIETTCYGNASKLRETLKFWSGGNAQVMEFISSHDALSLWVTKPEQGGILIYCVRCVDVKFKPFWNSVSFQVEGSSREDKESLIIQDGNNFSLKCWDAQITGVFKDFFEMTNYEESLTSMKPDKSSGQ